MAENFIEKKELSLSWMIIKQWTEMGMTKEDAVNLWLDIPEEKDLSGTRYITGDN